MHPGYGFLAENADFVRACEDNDSRLHRPAPDVMARMGDKAQAKAEMRAAGVPLVPGSEGAIVAEARAAADELGYPVLLKAAAGGGGRGMRLVDECASSRSLPARPRREADAAFGDGTLYVEKAITPARHVEIQVMCDSHGNVLTCGERECSIQRRHQKLIEESPVARARCGAARGDGGRRRARVPAHRLPQRRHVRVPARAGRRHFFIELNARLQVEHPVTELVTGIDLVREQLRVAAGRTAAR